jgi:hypothetical protein
VRGKEESSSTNKNGVHGGKISFSKNDALFLDVCQALSKHTTDSVIKGEDLREQLVVSGKFDAGEAKLSIDNAVVEGYLEKVDFDAYRLKEVNG